MVDKDYAQQITNLGDTQVKVITNCYYIKNKNMAISYNWWDKNVEDMQNFKFPYTKTITTNKGTFYGLDMNSTNERTVRCLKGTIHLIIVNTDPHSLKNGKISSILLTNEHQTVYIPWYNAIGYISCMDKTVVDITYSDKGIDDNVLPTDMKPKIELELRDSLNYYKIKEIMY